MSLKSDIVVDPAVFAPDAIPAETHAFNDKLQEIMATAPKMWEVGPVKYRHMRESGETPLPPPVILDTPTKFSIPSRDTGREIPCRVFQPQNGKTLRSVFMHIHGGGWVLGSEWAHDPMLQDISDTNGLLVISIGYRLAPENTYPAGQNDCYDAAEWLVDNAKATWGVPMGFVGGESAGGNLSALVALHLLQSKEPKYAQFNFKGLLLHYGAYSQEQLPSVLHFNKPNLVLHKSLMDKFWGVYYPNPPATATKDPELNPLWANLQELRGRLPPALFTCGTEDPLLDDTLFMSVKWMAAAGEAIVKIVPGAPHGFIAFPKAAKGSGSVVGLEAVKAFVATKLA